MRPSIIEIRSIEQFHKFIKSKTLVFVVFYSIFAENTYLIHCRDIFLKKAAHFLYGKSTAYGTVNTGLLPKVAEKANVDAVPTLAAFVKATEYKRLKGDASKWQIKTFVEEVLEEVF